MYQEERLLAVLQHLKEHGRISVQEMCDLFQISRDTARRDLVRLSEQNAIIRTRGGALLPTLNQEIRSYKERLDLKSEIKAKIGRKAAKYIHEHDTLLLDTSTTVQYAAQSLQAENVTVVTNSIDIADILSAKQGIQIHVLGGILHPRDRYLYGTATIGKLGDYKADKCLMGGGGITEEGIFFPSEENGQVVREMIRRAGQVIVLVDQTKFGKQLFYKVCGLEQIDMVITDGITEKWKSLLQQKEVEVVVANDSS